MTTFLICAALMLALALAAVLMPLSRARDASADANARRLRALDDALAAGVIDADEYAAKRAALETATAPAAGRRVSSRGARIALLAIVVLLPALSILLYRMVGTPEALDADRVAAMAVAAGTASDGGDMNKAIDGLAAKLEANPNDAQGWSLLGRAYQATERFAEARDALAHAHDLLPDDDDVTVEFAQASALASPGRRIDGAARDLLDGVLKRNPSHDRALWLVGIGEFQAQRYAEAVAAWNRLLPLLPADSDIARSVQTQIAEAQRLGGGGATMPPQTAPASAPAADPAPATAADANAPKLTVSVRLDDALKARLDPDATLFVFARAASGPPMPLAIQRLKAAQLPLTVTLDDGMGMLPTLKLSMFPQVVVGARVSKSGNAMPQSGDLQGLSAPLDVQRRDTIELTIDQTVP